MTHLFRPAFGLMVCGALVWAFGAPTSAQGGFFGLFGHGSSGGSWGSWGSSGGSSGGSWGSWGSSGGSSGGSWGSWGSSGGSSGGSWGSHGSSGGSWGSFGGSSGGSSGGYYYDDGHDDDGDDNDSAQNTRDSQVARVVVHVPAQAKVYLQDQKMSLSGRVRKFVSPRLSPNREYEYTVRVELDKDGNTLTKSEKVRVKAGQRVEVTVNFSQEKNELVATIARR